MKKTVKIALCGLAVGAALMGGAVAAVGPRYAEAASETKTPTATMSASRAEVVSSDAKYVRKALDYAPSTKYMVSAVIGASNLRSDYKFGLCAATNDIEQCLDLVLIGGEIASYATLYGTDRRYDLGYRRTITDGISSASSIRMTAIRDGDTFYLAVNGKLRQMRKFDIAPSVPGVTACGARTVADEIEYTADNAEVDAAIAELAYSGYGVANCHANYGEESITIKNENTFSFGARTRQNVLTYSRMAFDGGYSGDMEVSFTVSDLVPLASADTGDANKWPKLALLVYYDRGYEDMLCLGAAKKQDRIETYAFNAIVQWYNHSDLTGNASVESTIDRTGDIDFKIDISDTGTYKVFRIYVNGALFALRTSTAHGELRFGFAAEYVSATISDFTVTGK